VWSSAGVSGSLQFPGFILTTRCLPNESINWGTGCCDTEAPASCGGMHGHRFSEDGRVSFHNSCLESSNLARLNSNASDLTQRLEPVSLENNTARQHDYARQPSGSQQRTATRDICYYDVHVLTPLCTLDAWGHGCIRCATFLVIKMLRSGDFLPNLPAIFGPADMLLILVIWISVILPGVHPSIGDAMQFLSCTPDMLGICLNRLDHVNLSTNQLFVFSSVLNSWKIYITLCTQYC
jgi:hypothetical protein